MRWILAGCCGLALIGLSVTLQISQKPRFYGGRTSQSLSIYCLFSRHDMPSAVHTRNSTAVWYKADKYDGEKERIHEHEGVLFRKWNVIQNGFIHFTNVQIEDSGVYFCQVNGTYGPGTEVLAVKRRDVSQAAYRSKMKDGLIVIQGLLLAACIAAILLRKQKLMEKRDSEYEEPETDHIYEGLAIETCEGGLYEDLSAYARTEGTEAPWE
ncbi:B-cell antigen receptor complex-associated protein beta chain [Odontesthes bonariensis]|uniref:B-cell antigen receptor complex-associated protein beta chain n=1 Tax=Odontesthes bonariensis TaxID=219752 RepID=UPI003F589B42